MGPFEKELQSFHALDWRQNVSELNVSLAADRSRPAGIEESPPSIITGDPFALEGGNCVLVLGINPGWPNLEIQRIDCEPAQRAWEVGFDAYRSHRRPYFLEAAGRLGHTKNVDQRYNGRHFSRLGGSIARVLGVGDDEWDAGPIARRFFREHAAILDLLPYWSRNTENLSLTDALGQESVRQWRNVISAFISEKQPSLVIVNGNATRNRALIDGMLGCKLSDTPQRGFSVGRATTEMSGTAVLAHPFLSHWRGVTRQNYIDLFTEALTLLQIQTPLLTERLVTT